MRSELATTTRSAGYLHLICPLIQCLAGEFSTILDLHPLGRPSRLRSHYILAPLVVQRQTGHQTLEPGVLAFQCLEMLCLGDPQAVLATQLGYLHPSFGFLQHPNDLLFGKSRLAQAASSASMLTYLRAAWQGKS